MAKACMWTRREGGEDGMLVHLVQSRERRKGSTNLLLRSAEDDDGCSLVVQLVLAKIDRQVERVGGKHGTFVGRGVCAKGGAVSSELGVRL
jgi:hypothetical protein